MADNSDNPNDTADKNTNRVFTQSEVDQLVAKVVKNELAKFADYGDVKAKADALEAEKRERELSEKSEVEKAQVKLQEWEKKYGALESEYKAQKTVIVKNDVLADHKYAGLPKVYRDSIRLSENADEIKSHADEMLKQFQADMKGIKTNVGAPGEVPPTTPAPPKTLAEILKERATKNRR